MIPPALKLICPLVTLLATINCSFAVSNESGFRYAAVEIISSLDREIQPCMLILPNDLAENSAGDSTRRPLLVSLHSWSGDWKQRNLEMESGAIERGWICLAPNFRGVNQHPDACGSELAQQDILDAIQWAILHLPIDRSRIYISGASGGGHMTMLMAARYPYAFTAASAWVGIYDLAEWHALHARRNTRYLKMIESSCGGAPGDSDAIDDEYRSRSPRNYLAGATKIPLEIAAGVHDGHQGSVPIWHSLAAYNDVARANQTLVIEDEEIDQLLQPNGRLERPLASDQVDDASLGRDIYLRRQSNRCRITIFEGGHERVENAALEWLSQFRDGMSP